MHRARQLIANPAPNPLLVYSMPQSHVQYAQRIRAPQAGRNGASEIFVVEVPDAIARGAAVVIVCCTTMIHVCLGCRVCWSAIVLTWDAKPRTKPRLCDLRLFWSVRSCLCNTANACVYHCEKLRCIYSHLSAIGEIALVQELVDAIWEVTAEC